MSIFPQCQSELKVPGLLNSVFGVGWYDRLIRYMFFALAFAGVIGSGLLQGRHGRILVDGWGKT